MNQLQRTLHTFCHSSAFTMDVIFFARTGFKFAAFFGQALAPSIKTWEETCPESKGHDDTVDGRNPAPVDMVNISLFTGSYTSQVVQDFFHQPYHKICTQVKWKHMAIYLSKIQPLVNEDGQSPVSWGCDLLCQITISCFRFQTIQVKNQSNVAQ